MFEDLGKLIKFIQEKYTQINLDWKNSDFYVPINMKKKTVKDMSRDDELFFVVLNYRAFINSGNYMLDKEFKELKLQNEFFFRVKSQNSIEYKLNNYLNNHNDGEGPINKCFNDLLGMRIVLKDDKSFNDIKDYVNNNYSALKCIDSSKDKYVATHIYFKDDNFSFPWELQIWNKSQEEENIISHKNYKQQYAKWEDNNK